MFFTKNNYIDKYIEFEFQMTLVKHRSYVQAMVNLMLYSFGTRAKPIRPILKIWHFYLYIYLFI